MGKISSPETSISNDLTLLNNPEDVKKNSIYLNFSDCLEMYLN